MKKLFWLNIIISFVLILLSISCKQRNNEEVGSGITAVRFEEIPDSLRLTDNFKKISCVQLELTEESLLDKVKRIIDVEGNLVVLADGEIYVFRREDGKYLHRLGLIGEGPGEYIRAEDIYYDSKEKTIVACEPFKELFMYYRINGEFVKKENADIEISWMESIERASDGSLLITNELDSKTPEDCAFVYRQENGRVQYIDPFKPIYAEGYSIVWAKKPMSVYGSSLHFIKFMTDTVFSIEKGIVSPIYKLDFGRGMLSKESVAAMGSYGREYGDYCIKNHVPTHVSKMYETERYIALFPVYDHYEGYYWIDKATNTGFHIKGSAEFDKETRDVAKGCSIIQIVGNNEKELISCFDALYIPDSFKRAFEELKGEKALPDSVVRAIENVDPEGNPFLIIYSH